MFQKTFCQAPKFCFQQSVPVATKKRRDFELTSESQPKQKNRAQKQKDNANKINPNKECLKRLVCSLQLQITVEMK